MITIIHYPNGKTMRHTKKMMDELEDSNLTEITQVFAILSILVGMSLNVCLTQNEKMLHYGIAYGAINMIGEVWKVYFFRYRCKLYMESFPGAEDYS